MFVMELPTFNPDTALSFGEIDQFATMASDIMVICDRKVSKIGRTSIIFRINYSAFLQNEYRNRKDKCFN